MAAPGLVAGLLRRARGRHHARRLTTALGRMTAAELGDIGLTPADLDAIRRDPASVLRRR